MGGYVHLKRVKVGTQFITCRTLKAGWIDKCGVELALINCTNACVKHSVDMVLRSEFAHVGRPTPWALICDRQGVGKSSGTVPFGSGSS